MVTSPPLLRRFLPLVLLLPGCTVGTLFQNAFLESVVYNARPATPPEVASKMVETPSVKFLVLGDPCIRILRFRSPFTLFWETTTTWAIRTRRSKEGKRWKMPARYYSFSAVIDETTSVDFFCLDNTPLTRGTFDEQDKKFIPRSPEARAQVAWLDSALGCSSARWKIVLGHHHLYSGGPPGNNKELISLLEPLFTSRGVDLYLAGGTIIISN